jgi:hypothetical protein
MIWEGAFLNLKLSDGEETGQDIYLKLAANEHQRRTKGEMKSTQIMSSFVLN